MGKEDNKTSFSMILEVRRIIRIVYFEQGGYER